MVTTTIIQLLNAFKEPLSKISKDLKVEFLQLFDNGLPEYIQNYYDKYSMTKTFIYRDERVKFYDIFYPVTIKNQTKVKNLSDLKKLFNKRNFITIIGSAGSGKSMLMKHIFLSAVNSTFRIPIVLELRNLNDYDGSLSDYIVTTLCKNDLAKSSSLVDRILKEGNFLFLFDGYDEIYSASKDKITRNIEEFADTYNKNTFVITSRPGSNAESLQRFDNFYVQPLEKNQIREFIELQFKNHENSDSFERITSIIEKPDNRDYQDYLANPLLLSMFIFTFNNYPELPKYKSKFYWNVFDTLCTKHDSFSKKGFWLHERKSDLQNEDFENILKWFSYITIFKGKYNFDLEYFKNVLTDIKTKLDISASTEDIIYDLTVSISIIILDGTEYTFPHKSLQEYFCALLIKNLNEVQKEKIYNERFDELQKHTTGGNLNLYKLCFEMDKYFACKYYLLPRTEKYISSIDISDDFKIAFSMFKSFEIYFLINDDLKIGGYSNSNLTEDNYLAFFDLPHFLPSFAQLNGAVKILQPYLKHRLRDIKVYRFINILENCEEFTQDLEEFFQKSKIKENYVNLHKELIAKFEDLKLNIEKEKISTSQLLDI